MGAAADRASDRLVAVGYVSRAHGVGGEVRIERFDPESRTLFGVEAIVLRPRSDTGTSTSTSTSTSTKGRSMRVESVREAGKAVLARLEGVATREAADELRGSEVCVPRSALPEPDEDEVYLTDLVGLEAHEDGHSIGRVEDVVHHPAADCVRIATERGTIEVPLAPPYLVEVDLRDRVLRVAHTADFEPESG